jgi:hypothetical protein
MYDIKDNSNKAAHGNINNFLFLENKKPQPKVLFAKFEGV